MTITEENGPMEFMTTDCTDKEIKLTTVASPPSLLEEGRRLMCRLAEEQRLRETAEQARWNSLNIWQKTRESIAGLFTN